MSPASLSIVLVSLGIVCASAGFCALLRSIHGHHMDDETTARILWVYEAQIIILAVLLGLHLISAQTAEPPAAGGTGAAGNDSAGTAHAAGGNRAKPGQWPRGHRAAAGGTGRSPAESRAATHPISQAPAQAGHHTTTTAGPRTAGA